MFTTTKLALSVAIVLGIASAAPAASKERVDRHKGSAVERSQVYGEFAHCSPSRRIDLNRLQPGEMAIMIQSRGYRESIDGAPFSEGECW